MPFVPRRRLKKTKSKASAVAHSLNKLQKLEVKKLIKGPLEVKYVANYLSTGNLPIKEQVVTPTDCWSFLPACFEGTADHERIADEITPTRVVGHWNYYFDSSIVTSSIDCIVHLVVLLSKISPGFQTFGNLSTGTLLRPGDGTYRDPDDLNAVAMAGNINKMPFNTKSWQVLARRSFRMTKNLGQQNAEATLQSSNGQNGASSKQVTISFTKGLRKLSYLNPTIGYPANHYPVYLTWATTTDGRVLPTGGGTSALRWGFRSEMYYKDA